jgi:hypothetical protein
MKILSRSLLFAAAFSAVLAPALLAELPGARLRPVGSHSLSLKARPADLLPTGSGTGSGLWIAPTDVNGFASAKLYDSTGRQRYSLRATMVYFVPDNGNGDVQGGFFGVLLASSKGGKMGPVAEVNGTWIRHADGSGHFSADIVANSGGGSMVTIGQLAGSLQSPFVMPGPHVDPYDEPGDSAPRRARLAMNWTISE